MTVKKVVFKTTQTLLYTIYNTGPWRRQNGVVFNKFKNEFKKIVGVKKANYKNFSF